jgi:hypothetical protein
MPWFRAIHGDTSIADLFLSIWRASGGPQNALLFGIRDPRHMQYEYYFNPEAALLDPEFVRNVATQCDPPNIQERGLILVVGPPNKAAGDD